MIGFNKLAIAATVAVAGMVSMGGTASATFIPSCTGINSLGAWDAAYQNSCVIGDKKFTLVDHDLPNSYVIDFQQSGLSYSFIADGNISFDNEFISYIIEVIDPDYQITQVRLDSDITGTPGGIAGTTVTKTIRDANNVLLDTLVSTGGSTDASIPLAHTLLKITDVFNVAFGATMNAANNSFDQSLKAVPEPGALALFGVGLLGMGAVMRKRRAA